MVTLCGLKISAADTKIQGRLVTYACYFCDIHFNGSSCCICILVRLKHLTTQEENIGVHILNDSRIYFLFKYTQRIWTMNKYWMTNLETAHLWH